MMAVITIDKNTEEALNEIARQKAMTLDAVAGEALLSTIQTQAWNKKTYSFIGIGKSGQHDLSQKTEEILAESVNRREGWSLAE